MVQCKAAALGATAAASSWTKGQLSDPAASSREVAIKIERTGADSVIDRLADDASASQGTKAMQPSCAHSIRSWRLRDVAQKGSRLTALSFSGGEETMSATNLLAPEAVRAQV